MLMNEIAKRKAKKEAQNYLIGNCMNKTVKEAHKMNIPVMAMVDTNVDPTEVDFPIPANDDAAKSISLITSKIADVIMEAKQKASEKKALQDAANEEKAQAKAAPKVKRERDSKPRVKKESK